MQSDRIRVTAPGKILLSGEYAVLSGTPAICLALSCRADVCVRPSNRFSIDCQGIDDVHDTRLLTCVRNALGLSEANAAIELDTRAFSDSNGNKFGAGSSAALTVALCKALAPGLSTEALFNTALTAHRDLQQGRGSGVDIATSLVGGVVRYRKDQMPDRMSWPAGLNMAVLWSGQSASTVQKLAQFESTSPGAEYEALGNAAANVASSFESARRLLAALRHYGEALWQFDVAQGLGIFSAGHCELYEAAVQHDVIYKPCGAGGGDLGIVLADDRESVQSFADLATQRQHRLLAYDLDYDGVRVED